MVKMFVISLISGIVACAAWDGLRAVVCMMMH